MDRNERSDRAARDAAGVGPYARERESLVPLSTLSSWSVSEGEPDVRSWEVRTVSGRQLGNVKDLLIDPKAGEVVLLDVDLAASDRHTFVPIRVVQIDRARRIVLMDSADLPDSTLVRAGAAAAPPAGERGSVHYPPGDREVVVERTQRADEAAPVDEARVETPEGVVVDRRRAERRKIDRMSTDF